MILNFTLIWFTLTFLFLFLEMGHPGLLYFISFSFGSLFAFGASFYIDSLLLQQAIFLIGTCIALCLVHFFAKEKKGHIQIPSHRSNLDALIGQRVVVYLADENSQTWQARINGQVWLVRSVGDKPLKAGQDALVVDVQGCHLRVRAIHINV